MEICEAHDIYQRFTQLNELSYCFTPKHHGGRDSRNATWLPELSRAEEFMVFDMADNHQLADAYENLYWLRIQESRGVREIHELGIWHEYIARFWHEDTQSHWHGHPLWRVGENGPENRTTQKYCPPKSVFERMIQAGIVTVAQASRLKTGKHLRKL